MIKTKESLKYVLMRTLGELGENQELVIGNHREGLSMNS